MAYQYIQHVNGVDKRDSHKAYRIIEDVLGKSLPQHAVVHHINGDTSNQEHANLVACEDEAYHQLLHMRTRALIACGHASWRKCQYCKEYDAPENLYIALHNKSVRHKRCFNLYRRERKTQRAQEVLKELVRALGEIDE